VPRKFDSDKDDKWTETAASPNTDTCIEWTYGNYAFKEGHLACNAGKEWTCNPAPGAKFCPILEPSSEHGALGWTLVEEDPAVS